MKLTKTNVLLSALLLLVIFLTVYTVFFPRTKVAYVDSTKLLNGYKAMVEARKQYEQKEALWKSNIDSLTNDVKDAINDYNKRVATSTKKEQDLSKQLISVKQKQLYDYQNAIKMNASQEEQRLTQNVLTTVNSYLLRYGKKHSYKLILIAANGNIAYADSDMDITDKVVEDLNKEYAVPVK